MKSDNKKYLWIVRDPETLGGKPIVRGTRLSVVQILRCLSYNMDLAEIREMYGDFPAEAIPEVLRFASVAVEREQVDVAS
jgi:uncharacterized protein (DUF433 family)